MIIQSELTKLCQWYIANAEDQIESDGFLPGLDVTNKAATELFNDVILFGIESGRVRVDTDEKVTCTEIVQ